MRGAQPALPGIKAWVRLRTLLEMNVKSKKSAQRGRGTPDETGSGKDLGNYTGFAHSRITAHFHSALAGYSTTTYDPIAAFLPSRLFEWIPQVARYWFHKKHAFRDYTTHGKGTGIFPIDERVKISIAGDWGTGTDEIPGKPKSDLPPWHLYPHS
jgi:hypothetical protein